MEIDYKEIGRRIANRRRQLGLRQSEVEERAEISCKYLSSIERANSIPSTEVIMRLARVLDTTPDEFLVGSSKSSENSWIDVAVLLKTLNKEKLNTARSFLKWLNEQN